MSISSQSYMPKANLPAMRDSFAVMSTDEIYRSVLGGASNAEDAQAGQLETLELSPEKISLEQRAVNLIRKGNIEGALKYIKSQSQGKSDFLGERAKSRIVSELSVNVADDTKAAALEIEDLLYSSDHDLKPQPHEPKSDYLYAQTLEAA